MAERDYSREGTHEECYNGSLSRIDFGNCLRNSEKMMMLTFEIENIPNPLKIAIPIAGAAELYDALNQYNVKSCGSLG